MKQRKRKGQRKEKVNKGKKIGAESQESWEPGLVGYGEGRTKDGDSWVFPTLTTTYRAVQAFLLWASGLVGVKNND